MILSTIQVLENGARNFAQVESIPASIEPFLFGTWHTAYKIVKAIDDNDIGLTFREVAIVANISLYTARMYINALERGGFPIYGTWAEKETRQFFNPETGCRVKVYRVNNRHIRWLAGKEKDYDFSSTVII